MNATGEPPGDADYRLLTCPVMADVEAAPDDCLDASDLTPGQFRAGDARERPGRVVYPSVRYPAGLAAAVFWPNCLTLPIAQDQQLRYLCNNKFGVRLTTIEGSSALLVQFEQSVAFHVADRRHHAANILALRRS